MTQDSGRSAVVWTLLCSISCADSGASGSRVRPVEGDWHESVVSVRDVRSVTGVVGAGTCVNVRSVQGRVHCHDD